MVFFAETSPTPFLEATDSKTRESLRYTHPDLWPYDAYLINHNDSAVEMVARGCLAAPTLDVTFFTHEPMVYTPTGYYNYDEPSLTKIVEAMNRTKSRWLDHSYSHGNSDEVYRTESLLFTPKTPAIRAEFLRAFETLDSHELADKVLSRYRASRFKRLTITQEVYSKMQNNTYSFHALHDVIGTDAPKFRASRGDASFYLEKQSSKLFKIPTILKTYVTRAQDIATMIGGPLGKSITRDLAPLDGLIADFALKLKERRREEPRYRDRSDEMAPHAWHSSIVSRGYGFADSYDNRHSQLHWAAAIVDYIVNLHDVYKNLAERKIPTSIPTIAAAIRAKNLMHIPRSLEALTEPGRKPEPVSLALPPEKSVIFIGSNNSGKSFTMEMIVANAMESMQGRKTFAKSFESPEFDAIIAIPAELPQETGKSTYTGQLAKLVEAIKEIIAIQEVKPDAHVLLIADELFAGTDEQDSAALYKATIEWMNEHHVTLVGATNNELVFDPEIAEFISMVNRKPVVVLRPEDIVAKRQGIPILGQAGLPEAVVARASELAGETIDHAGDVAVSDFTDIRSTHTMGITETFNKEVFIGKNFRLWDHIPNRPPLFYRSATFEKVFGSPADDPIKLAYRQWETELATETQVEHAATYVYGISGILRNCMEIPERLRNIGQDTPDEKIRTMLEGFITTAQQDRDRLAAGASIRATLPASMTKDIDVSIDTAQRLVDALGAIETDEVKTATIRSAIEHAVSPIRSLTREQLFALDTTNSFFHLQRIFRTNGFCTVTESTDNTLSFEGVFHTGLLYEHITKNDPETITTNTLSVSSETPTVLLGANASGKSTLAESILIASYFAKHFGHAPAASFSIPNTLHDAIGLVDYLRDPERPKDRGKWYSRQTQIASIVKKAKSGGYIVVLDEPGEGTNGFEGRATLIALAEYLTACGNLVLFTTHQHKAVDILEETSHVQAFASGLGNEGRYSFAPGRASSLGLEMALEEGLPEEIVNRAKIIKAAMTNTSELI